MALCQSIPLTGADQVVRAAITEYRGYTARETGGSAATVRIFDNASAASGTLLDSFDVPAGSSRSAFYDPPLQAVNGIFVDVGGTGTVEGSIRIG